LLGTSNQSVPVAWPLLPGHLIDIDGRRAVTVDVYRRDFKNMDRNTGLDWSYFHICLAYFHCVLMSFKDMYIYIRSCYVASIYPLDCPPCLWLHLSSIMHSHGFVGMGVIVCLNSTSIGTFQIQVMWPHSLIS
jgi:hypothetical protein